jgi:hypothetical protein
MLGASHNECGSRCGSGNNKCDSGGGGNSSGISGRPIALGTLLEHTVPIATVQEVADHMLGRHLAVGAEQKRARVELRLLPNAAQIKFDLREALFDGAGWWWQWASAV